MDDYDNKINNMKYELKYELIEEFRNTCKEEILEDFNEDIKETLKEELNEELNDKIRNEIKKELRHNFKKDLKYEIVKQIKEELRSEIIGYVEHELGELKTLYETRIKDLDDSIKTINNKLGKLKLGGNTIENFKCINEIYNETIVRSKLESSSLTSDFNFFKLLFMDNKQKSEYSIMFENKVFYYWLDNQWNVDKNCEYIIDIIMKTIKFQYYNVNKFDSYKSNMDRFIKNQAHIVKLDTKKYINSFIERLKKFCSKK